VSRGPPIRAVALNARMPIELGAAELEVVDAVARGVDGDGSIGRREARRDIERADDGRTCLE
jgi:hypothetical protein